ncbi:hypothetical protein J3F83DRAFT_737937 [Trichoderma novae-zelandiae]
MLFNNAVWLLAASSASASGLQWHWRNYPGVKPVSPLGRTVTIQVPPDTDIWRPALSKHNFTAPCLYTAVPAPHFRSVQVTVTGAWKTLYDQGGLVVSFPNRHGDARLARFIKAGIEFNDGGPALGVVATDVLSDWSLSPITEPQAGADAEATILIERDGTDAWVYVLEGRGQGRTRRALRQVTWAFNEDDGQGLAREVEVGIYGAKPTEEAGEGHARDTIAVSFSGFALKTVRDG